MIVDDAAQHVSHVVRGADLLLSTAWQIRLQTALCRPSPHYAHLPLVVEETGEKLGKSRHSVAVDPGLSTTYLTIVLRMLNHAPPRELEKDTPARLLAWAVDNWNRKALAGARSVTTRDIAHAK